MISLESRQGFGTTLVGAGPLQEVLECNYIIGVGLKESYQWSIWDMDKE